MSDEVTEARVSGNRPERLPAPVGPQANVVLPTPSPTDVADESLPDGVTDEQRQIAAESGSTGSEAGSEAGTAYVVGGLDAMIGVRRLTGDRLGLAAIKGLADQAYTEQAQMGVSTEILMLPTASVYEALGVQPPAVPVSAPVNAESEQPESIPDGSA